MFLPKRCLPIHGVPKTYQTPSISLIIGLSSLIYSVAAGADTDMRLFKVDLPVPLFAATKIPLPLYDIADEWNTSAL